MWKLRSVMPLMPLLSLAMAGCDVREPTWRTYNEETIDSGMARSADAAPMARTAAASPAAAVRWTAPAGWTEEAGSGMRLATFKVSRDAAAGTCTIVTLGGAAGGLEPNVRRWIGQLKLPVPDTEGMAIFLAKQKEIRSAGGYEGVVVDLTSLGESGPETPSMLAAILKVDGASLFVKLTGPVNLLKAELESFTKLCESVRTGS